MTRVSPLIVCKRGSVGSIGRAEVVPLLPRHPDLLHAACALSAPSGTEGCLYEHTVIYHCSALRSLHSPSSHTGSFPNEKKTPRTAENYARESRILKQARQDVRVTASMLTGSTEVAATPSLMGE